MSRPAVVSPRRILLSSSLAVLLAALLGRAPSLGAGPGRFEPVGNMTVGRNYPAATLLMDGSVLVTGGETSDRVNGFYVTATAERFHPETNTFTPLESMNQRRMLHLAVRLLDGRVLVLGGLTGSSTYAEADQVLRTAELFEPATAKFVKAGEMLDPHGWGATATLLRDGRVLVVGGFSDLNQNRQLATAELFDPATGQFQPTGSLSRARAGHEAVLLADGRVAIVGGLRPVEIYDPATGAFSLQGQTATTRRWSTAVLRADGKVVIASGSDRRTEIYDPTTGESQFAGSGSRTRIDHAGLLLADERLLIAGGLLDPTAVFQTAELVDTATGTVTETASLLTPRAGGAAVLLPDGRALILGGTRKYGTPDLDTAEVYVP